MVKVKSLSVKEGKKYKIHRFPSFHRNGSISGMKRMYYGKNSLLVRCGNYIYNVTSKPSIYHKAK